jgi:hypothetical protein
LVFDLPTFGISKWNWRDYFALAASFDGPNNHIVNVLHNVDSDPLLLVPILLALVLCDGGRTDP